MEKQTITYKAGGKECKGIAFFDASKKEKRPAIVLAHAWRGLEDYAKSKAEEIANLGYVVFAADLYGDGQIGATDQEAGALMLPLFKNRKLLRERILGAFEATKIHPLVEPDKIGAVGFCFGGLTVIELYKSGAPVKGVVCFHGILGANLKGNQAVTEPTAKVLKGSILVLHGEDDPFVTQGDIDNFKSEMNKAKADWQFHIFGHTVHAFTNPSAQDTEGGMIFNALSSKRSWKLMRNFFEEVFSK